MIRQGALQGGPARWPLLRLVMYMKNSWGGGRGGGAGWDLERTHDQFVLCYKVKEIRVKYGFGIAWLSVVSPAYNVVVIVVYIYIYRCGYSCLYIHIYIVVVIVYFYFYRYLFFSFANLSSCFKTCASPLLRLL